MKKLLALLVVLGFFLCVEAGAEVQYVTVGSVNPLSGPAAPWGVPADNSLKLAAEQINTKGIMAEKIYKRTTEGFVVNGKTYKWKVESYDSQYNATEALNAVMRLADNNVKYAYIMGASIALATYQVTSRNGMLTMAAAALGKTGLNTDHPMLFQFETEGEVVAAAYPWLKETYDIKDLVFIAPDDDGGYATNDFAQFVAKKQNLNYAVEYFDRGTTDFYPMLTRILAKKPDCIDTGPSPPDTAVLILKQARELGFKGVFFAGQGVNPDMLFKVAGPEYAEGLVVLFTGAVDYSQTMQLSVDTYIQKFGKEAWLDYCLLFIDALFVVTQAMEEAQSLDPKVIAAYMPKMKVKHTLWDPHPRFWTGGKYYGVNHILINPVLISRVEKGKFVFKQIAPVPPGILE